MTQKNTLQPHKVMKEAKLQDAISLLHFKVEKCHFINDSAFNSEDISMKFQFATGFRESECNTFQVKFLIELSSSHSLFSINIETSTLFSTNNAITDEFKNSDLATINAPAIAFPFLRSFIQTFCVNAGIAPIVLPAFNFAEAK